MIDDTEQGQGRSAGARARRVRDRVRTSVRSASLFGAGIGAALVAVLLYTIAVPPPPPLTATDVTTAVSNVLASQTPPPADAEVAYAQVAGAIVVIVVENSDAPGATDPGLGTGVIVDLAGDILTALHVVEKATSITVTFADGSESGAQVVARQPEHDIAVLRAVSPPASFVPATLGNPNVPIGSDAFVVGSPFGLYGSLSAGVVSGLDRSFRLPDSDTVLKGLIQVDAAINPGSSGGPLLNRAGQVIGIVTGLVNPEHGDFFVGVGLAVPIDVAGGAAGLPQY